MRRVVLEGLLVCVICELTDEIRHRSTRVHLHVNRAEIASSLRAYIRYLNELEARSRRAVVQQSFLDRAEFGSTESDVQADEEENEPDSPTSPARPGGDGGAVGPDPPSEPRSSGLGGGSGSN